MKVLLAASEVAPIIKIGGLGDVIGSLPKALEKIGVNADVIVPYYPKANLENLKVYKSLDLEVPFDNANHEVEVYNTKLPGSNVDVLMLKNAEFFSSEKNETEVFTFFDKAVVEYIKSQFNTYDVVHCHDWHTGLITHLLTEELHQERPATLFTIHNLFYPGTGEPHLVKKVGISPHTHRLIDYDIGDGDLNLIYQGITSSDYISTVSETYAEEIKTEEFGREMAEILKSREDVLTGIVNGIDYSAFDRDFDKSDWDKKKPEHKKELQEMFGLDVSEKPVFSFVSRLDPGQKGLDILLISISHIVQSGGQFVLLGTGAKDWEEKFAGLMNETKYQGDISINIKFNIEMANKIYSGSDFFFVPSRYEPCGLTQMLAMYYGTIPIVREVGGLKDTVKDGYNGFKFKDYSSLDLNKAIDRAIRLYQDKKEYEKMIEQALDTDFSWDRSAKKYVQLYQKIIDARK